MTAKKVAEYFIWKAASQKRRISNKKLQKLLYYSQAWSLVINDKKIFKDKIEAWIHGPAIRNVYLEYKDFGFGAIEKAVDDKIADSFTPEEKKLLDDIWKIYGKFDADYLEQLTHSERPWQEAREGIEPQIGSTNEISTETMKEFYTELLEKKTQK